jgi:SP family myo-inositol transporter-like MFS transporter 13
MEGGVPDADISAFRECLSLSWKNPYILRLAFSAGIGGLLFGYDTGNYFTFLLFSYITHNILIQLFLMDYSLDNNV